MGEASGAFTGLEKTGTLLKLNKGARAWAYSDVKPKTVHLRDPTGMTPLMMVALNASITPRQRAAVDRAGGTLADGRD